MKPKANLYLFVFKERKFSQDENPSNLVLNIQFEILQEENLQLREKIELLQVVPSPNIEKERPRTRILLNRTSPDGQEHTEEDVEKLIRAVM